MNKNMKIISGIALFGVVTAAIVTPIIVVAQKNKKDVQKANDELKLILSGLSGKEVEISKEIDTSTKTNLKNAIIDFLKKDTSVDLSDQQLDQINSVSSLIERGEDFKELTLKINVEKADAKNEVTIKVKQAKKMTEAEKADAEIDVIAKALDGKTYTINAEFDKLNKDAIDAIINEIVSKEDKITDADKGLMSIVVNDTKKISVSGNAIKISIEKAPGTKVTKDITIKRRQTTSEANNDIKAIIDALGEYTIAASFNKLTQDAVNAIKNEIVLKTNNITEADKVLMSIEVDSDKDITVKGISINIKVNKSPGKENIKTIIIRRYNTLVEANALLAKFDSTLTLTKDALVATKANVKDAIKAKLTDNDAKNANFTIDVSSLNADGSEQDVIVTVTHTNGKTANKTIKVTVPTTNTADQDLANALAAKFNSPLTLDKDTPVATKANVKDAIKAKLTDNDAKNANFTIDVSSLNADGSEQDVIVTVTHTNGKTANKTIKVTVPTTNTADQDLANALAAKFNSPLTLDKDTPVATKANVKDAIKAKLTDNDAKNANFTIDVSSLNADGSEQDVIVTVTHTNGKKANKTIKVTVPTTNTADQDLANALAAKFNSPLTLDKDTPVATKANVKDAIKAKLTDNDAKNANFTIDVSSLNADGSEQDVIVTVTHTNGKKANKTIKVTVPTTNTADQDLANALAAKFNSPLTLDKDTPVATKANVKDAIKAKLTDNDAKNANFTIDVSSLNADGSEQDVIVTVTHTNGKKANKTIKVTVSN